MKPSTPLPLAIAEENGRASERVTLRSMYAAAVDAVNADPAAAVADYKRFLNTLVAERRDREK